MTLDDFIDKDDLKLRANGLNNSQHCCANNVGSCCVRVGSGVQTDATTPNTGADPGFFLGGSAPLTD